MREAIHNTIMNSSIAFAWLSNKELSIHVYYANQP